LLTQGTSPEPMRYTCQRRDAESGFYDLRARYYSPGLGRFISRDPLFGSLGSPLSLNRYSYVLNNPTNLTDPSGLASTTPNDPTIGSTIRVSIALQDSYGSKGFPPQGQQGCNGTDISWCVVIGIGHGGIPFAFVLGNPCDFLPWMCPGKDESGGSSSSDASGKINISQKSLGHVLTRHTVGGAENEGNSIFAAAEDIVKLIRVAEGKAPAKQAGGNFERIVDAGRSIGVDRTTSLETSIYTVITDAANNLVTAFPGMP
jgi:RHS repeat-associated protein